MLLIKEPKWSRQCLKANFEFADYQDTVDSGKEALLPINLICL
jgi:hypothetical protein